MAASGLWNGWSPVVKSMMARRRAPRRARSWPTMRSPSGPRWASAAAMAAMQSGCLSGAPERETAPKMPHITSPPDPLSTLWRGGVVVRRGGQGGGRLAGAIRRVVVVGGEEGQRGSEGGARLAMARARQEHGGHGAARQCLAPVARREQRRARDRAEPLHVVGDVVARELSARLGRDRDGAAEIERERRGIGEDAEHGAGAAAALERRGGGARHGGGGAVLPHRDEEPAGQKRDRHDDHSIPENRGAGSAGKGAEPDEDGGAEHHDPERHSGRRDGGFLGRREA